METNIAIPTGNRTGVLSHEKTVNQKQKDDPKVGTEFLDNFINTLITNLNPNDLSLDSSTGEKLSNLLASELGSNPSLSNIDLKQFIKNLKTELSNVKPHKLNLEALEDIVTKLLSKSPLTSLNSETITFNTKNFDKANFNNLLTATQNKASNIKDEAQADSTTSATGKHHKISGSVEKLLLNLRKFLTKEEFIAIKKNLLADGAETNSQAEPKGNAIQKLLSVISGKEHEAKSKIDLKTANVALDALHTDFEANPQLQNDPNALISKKAIANAADALKASAQQGTDQPTQKSSFSLENSAVRFEIDAQNGQTKLVFDQANDGLSDKGFSKEQRKEMLKQNILKSDLSGLLGETKAKKIEVKKADTIMKSNFVENVIKNIKMSKSGANNTARIMLTPRTLGDITLRISMVGNSVKLHIKADKSETAEHIDRQLPLLKERLNDNGLKVEQVIIDSAESENLTYFNQNQDKNEQKELRRQFIDSFRNLAAKEDFELSLDNVAYYNIDSPIMSYNKVGSKVNV